MSRHDSNLVVLVGGRSRVRIGDIFGIGGEQLANDVYRSVLSLPEEEKRVLYVSQKAYAYHKICALLGLDWQPHPNVIHAMRTKTAHRKWTIPKHKDDFLKFMKNAMDPRVELFEQLIHPSHA